MSESVIKFICQNTQNFRRYRSVERNRRSNCERTKNEKISFGSKMFYGAKLNMLI